MYVYLTIKSQEYSFFENFDYRLYLEISVALTN